MRRRTRDTPVRWCLTPYGQRVVAGNLGLVGRACERYRGAFRLDRQELEAAAYLGLCEAAARFDPKLGFAFSTYAYYWMTRAIRNAADEAWIIRVPRWLADSRGRDHRYQAHRRRAMGIRRYGPESPTFGAVAAREDENPLAGTVDLWDAIRRLPYRERFVIRCRLRGLTLRMIGGRIRRAHDRVRHLELKATRRLRRILEASP